MLYGSTQIDYGAPFKGVQKERLPHHLACKLLCTEALRNAPSTDNTMKLQGWEMRSARTHMNFLHPSLPNERSETTMANYAIMRIAKRKLGSVSKLNNHHERQKNSYKSNPDIDTTRTGLNYHIVEPTSTYRKMALARIEEVGAKMRKDSVVMQDCFIGATPDWIKGKSSEEQRAFFDYAYQFFEQNFGKENILSAVVHMDEATPHMHLCFVPITDKGKLSSKTIIGGPKGLVAWQDRYYEHISKRYPDIDRGIPAKLTHRKHIPPFMFKVAGQLYDHYDEICSAINDIGLMGNAKKKDAAIALLGRYAPEMAKLKVQLQSTDKHIAYLESELLSERNVTSRYRSKNYEQELDLQEANNKIYELNRKQKELEKVISQIPPEVLQRMAQQEREERKKRNKGWER